MTPATILSLCIGELNDMFALLELRTSRKEKTIYGDS